MPEWKAMCRLSYTHAAVVVARQLACVFRRASAAEAFLQTDGSASHWFSSVSWPDNAPWVDVTDTMHVPPVHRRCFLRAR